jgi:hypothetical protein
MEVNDIFADKVVELGVTTGQPIAVKIRASALAVIIPAGDITDRRIEPNVEILSRMSGDFKAKIGGVAADIPVLQSRINPFA